MPLNLNLYVLISNLSNEVTFQALDNRMVHFVNNIVAIVTLVIQSYVFSWQISLAGTGLLVLITLSIYYFGHLAQIRNTRTSGFHETANVRVLIFKHTN